MARDFDTTITQQAKGLAIALISIAQMPQMKIALAQGDRDALQHQWASVFSQMREEGVTHFYFYDAQRIALLRLHQPLRHGDLIDRFSARQAQVTQKSAWGIELGPMGTFCKKRTHPATRDVLIRPPMTFSFGHQKRC